VTIEVRTATPDEHVAWLDAATAGFLSRDSPERLAFRAEGIEADERILGAYDTAGGPSGGRPVGTYRSFAGDISVPGGALVPVRGVTAVTVAATHRRHGILRRMMSADLEATRDEGTPLSVLVAAEWPIYGRFGFGPATDSCAWTVDARAEFRGVPGGEVRLVSGAELRAVAPAIFDRYRRAYHGEISRVPRQWDVQLHVVTAPGSRADEPFCMLLVADDGEPAGFGVYHVESSWVGNRPRSTLVFSDLIAVDDAAAARLWQFASTFDWVAAVRGERRPVSDPIAWFLTDGRAAVETDRSDSMWARVLDVPVALAARSYRAPAHLVVDVVDDLGFAEGRFALDVSPEGATCTPTTRSPHVTMPAWVLGAAYLGGAPLVAMGRAGLLDEHVTGGTALADLVFGTADPPRSSTFF
jgi:predicted acetyltransferase